MECCLTSRDCKHVQVYAGISLMRHYQFDRDGPVLSGVAGVNRQYVM